MIDLEHQIHDYVDASFEQVLPTDPGAVVAGHQPASRRRRRWSVGVAAAMVVVLVASAVGIATWVSGDDPPSRVGSGARVPAVGGPPSEVDTDPVPSAAGEWSVELGGETVYAPVVVGGSVVVVTASAVFTRSTIHALDTSTGATRWTQDLGSSVWSQPVVAGDALFFRLLDDRLVVLDGATGSVRWSVPTGRNVKGPPPPLVAGSTVYVGSQDGLVQAYALADASLRWSRRLDEAVHSPPVLSSSEGVLYVSTGELPLGPESRGGIYAIDAAGGTVEWRHRTRAPVLTSPALGGAAVAVTTTDFGDRGRARLVRVWIGGETASAVELLGTASAPVYGSGGNFVVSVGNGFVEARSRLARSRPAWEVLVGADQQSPALIEAGGRLVAAGSGIVGIDGRSGEVAWRVRFPDAYFGDSDHGDRIVAVSRRGSLMVVDTADGTVVARYDLHDSPPGAVLTRDQLLWVNNFGRVQSAILPPATGVVLRECIGKMTGPPQTPDGMPAKASVATDEAAATAAAARARSYFTGQRADVRGATARPATLSAWVLADDGTVVVEQVDGYEIVVELASVADCPSGPFFFEGMPTRFYARS